MRYSCYLPIAMKSFDIAISFAGEDRRLAQELAHLLKEEGLLVFYDDDEQAQLLGENLTEYLSTIYKNEASYCVVLVSENYVRKRWSRYEWRAAQARAFEEFDQAYILPVRIDDAELPGLHSTVGYLSLGSKTIREIASLIKEKVRSEARINAIIRAANKAFHTGDFRTVVDLLADGDVFTKLLGDTVAMRLLSDAYMHIGDYEHGAQVLEEVTKRFSQDADSHFLLGVCQYRNLKFTSAIASYEKAVALAPFHQTALADLKRAKMRKWTERFPRLQKVIFRYVIESISENFMSIDASFIGER